MQANRVAHVSAVALVLVISGLIFAQTRNYGLLGMDSYPIILTSRVLSLGDLWGNVSERLMDGYYPAAFYRPLLNLSFALDHALWGLSAVGYQLSNVFWFAASALALYAFLVSRPVSRPAGYALVGVVFYLLHPLQFEVLPFPPRRPEFLCLAFLLLALAVEARRGWRFQALGAAATFCAVASKETAVILPALVFLKALLYPSGELQSWRGAWLAAGRRAAMSAAPILAYLVIRVAVLGGLGGRGKLSLAKALDAFPQNLGTLLRTVTSPSSSDSWWLAGIWLLLSLSVLTLAFRVGRRRWVADLSFAVAWLILLAGIYALSGRLSPWYVVLAIVPFAIALSAICEGFGTGFFLARPEPSFSIRMPRWAGALGLVSVVALMTWSQLQWAPALRTYPLWQRATEVDNQLLERFDQLLEQTDEGSMVRLLEERKKIKGKGDAAMFQGVVLQAHYSLQAWAALRHPQREVRVLKNRRPLKSQPLQPSEVVVILDRAPKPKRPAGKDGRPAAKSQRQGKQKKGKGSAVQASPAGRKAA